MWQQNEEIMLKTWLTTTQKKKQQNDFISFFFFSVLLLRCLLCAIVNWSDRIGLAGARMQICQLVDFVERCEINKWANAANETIYVYHMFVYIIHNYRDWSLLNEI